ncbi:PREDICTED: F-box/kelch-repeat protein At2g43270-like [Camelina sativa]|uniref:F-box/kelch-repeat protein At2g43270-like n=1 Tax=Camelina sativa TaxID=90675 RepID=A0ABM1RCX1_CAMSA|nr:PREDICTED: F-box/kelch-repeat protein At2g43270-like [Camelina sativa]
MMKMMYLVPDLQEEIILRLPLKSIRKFKTVSKQWRSIMESMNFTERRMSLQKNHRKILAAGVERSESPFEGDEEIEVVYLHCDDVTLPSLTCDGLVCIPVSGWVNIINPTTGEFLRFPSGPDPDYPVTHRYQYEVGKWHYTFPALWAMGFGRDKVSKSFKVVRMFFDPYHYCEVLDVNIGQWRRTLCTPPYLIDARRKTACVNGSIYWLNCSPVKLLAFDLHTQKFRDVPFLPLSVSLQDQLVNHLDDRLAIATPYVRPWKLEIWTMDVQKEEDGWTLTYSIPLSSCRDLNPFPDKVHFRPLTFSFG